MAMIPETLANLNLFVDGISFQGDVPSLTLPKLTLKMEEHRPGGMNMTVELDMGMEKQEASFTTTGVRREALNHFGLADGTEFDSSWSRGKPFQCVIGTGRVIKGWDQGIMGMRVGGKRKLLVPAHLGYGARSVGSIPPDSDLAFEIELLEVLTRDD